MELEQYSLTSESGEYTREIWYAPGPGDAAHPLCLFLDAELYLQSVDALPLIRELMSDGEMPPASLLFVSRVDGAARHHDYTCNDRYARFIAGDVVQWAGQRNAATQSDNNILCGISLSGLASAYITLRYPGVFSRCLSQSGSFWWLWGKEIAFPRTTAKFWLSVGHEETVENVSHPPTGLYQEVSQITGVEQAVRLIESLGGTVKHHIYAGGHAIAPWQAELKPALRWLTENAGNRPMDE